MYNAEKIAVMTGGVVAGFFAAHQIACFINTRSTCKPLVPNFWQLSSRTEAQNRAAAAAVAALQNGGRSTRPRAVAAVNGGGNGARSSSNGGSRIDETVRQANGRA